MRHLLWSALAASTLVSGCDTGADVHISSTSGTTERGVLKVVDTLQCPQVEGVLTRKGSADVDGRTCTYAGPRGSEVQLQLVSLNNTTADATLRQFETLLSSELPEALTALSRPPVPATHEGSRTGADIEAVRIDVEAALADVKEARADIDSNWADVDAARADAEAARSETLAGSESASGTAGGGDAAHVRLPGVTVESQGAKATVRLPGMKIESDGDKSVVRIGGLVIRSDSRTDSRTVTVPSGANSTAERVSVDANRNATRIHAKAPGEPIRATYRLTMNRNRTSTWRSVGYEARGPVGGPVVVALIRNRADNDDRVFEAAKALVTLNVGK